MARQRRARTGAEEADEGAMRQGWSEVPREWRSRSRSVREQGMWTCGGERHAKLGAWHHHAGSTGTPPIVERISMRRKETVKDKAGGLW